MHMKSIFQKKIFSTFPKHFLDRAEIVEVPVDNDTYSSPLLVPTNNETEKKKSQNTKVFKDKKGIVVLVSRAKFNSILRHGIASGKLHRKSK